MTHHTTWHALSGFQRDILVAIAAQTAPNGQAIKRHVETAHPEDSTDPRLYDNLDALADQGLVDKTAAQPSNTYRLTDAGQQALHNAADRLTAVVDAEAQP